LRIDRIRVKDKEIVFYGVAKVEQFPQRKQWLVCWKFLPR
jgi:hypothetical protein